MRLPALILLCLAPTLSHARDDAPFLVKDGDRVVFYGDSITDQRLYTSFVETYVVTRFPGWKVNFVHSGWGGDRVGGGGGGPVDVRLDRDVLAYKPTVVTVMLGMNDASYRAFDPAIFKTYCDGYRHIVDRLKRDLPGVRLTLIRPSPFDDVTRRPNFEGGYNAVLGRYGDFVAGLASEAGATVADLNTPVVEATRRAYVQDSSLSRELNRDRVHPGPGGQLLMAGALLRAWNAPAVVSSVEIDAAPGSMPRVKASARAKVDTLANGPDGALGWTETDEALPFPVDRKDAPTRLALASSTFMDDLDRQVLKVNGLPKPEYTLKIDGREVAAVSSEALAAGVNLANFDTPMFDQAKRVHALTTKHNDIHFDRWRNYQVPFSKDAPEAVAKAIEGLDAIEAVVVARRAEAARPVPHKFELVPRG